MGKNKPFHEKTYLHPSKRHAMIDSLLGELEREKEEYQRGFEHHKAMKDFNGFDEKNWMIHQFLLGKSMAVLAYLNQEFDSLGDAYDHISKEIADSVGIKW
tara:strand:- start:1918 stop:2220 length:303 start_codon:yes stop_codon:yes gene_type:complete